MLMKNVYLPELGEGIAKATVAFWHSQHGEHVQEGNDLVELVTDKASFNVPANATGILKEARFQVGEEASVGVVLAVIDEG